MTKVFVLEVMGRHAGWIAAAGGLAGATPDDAPHIILLPEVPFNQHKFLQRVKQSVEKNEYCVIVVSEGARYKDGRFLADAGTTDAFGHKQLGGAAQIIAQLVRDKLGYKYHYAVADYLQRSARHIASATDLTQAYAVGKAAVEMALAGENAVMPAIIRTADKPYKWRIEAAPLARVANKEKMMPKKFISSDGFGITAACRRYLEPLIKGEAYPPYKNGLPVYADLKKISVRKKLKTDYKL